jgi:hypothetical protein
MSYNGQVIVSLEKIYMASFIFTKRPQPALDNANLQKWLIAKQQPAPKPAPRNILAFKNNGVKLAPQNFFAKQHQPGFFAPKPQPPTMAMQQSPQMQAQNNRNFVLQPKFGCTICGDMDHVSAACNKQRPPSPGAGR